MVRLIMLQAYRGTVDANGIRTLRIEAEHETRCRRDRRTTEFWAVMSAAELPLICATLQAGDRWRAMKLVSERAVSLGSVLPLS